MKKLVILSDESVLAGSAQTGVGEVVDSLAHAISAHYQTTVICQGGGGVIAKLATNVRQVSEGVQLCRMFGVDYYMVKYPWQDKAVALAEKLKPDILHNFAAPELLDTLSQRPERCVYTIDQAKYVRGRETYLSGYDAVTTVSETYAQELLSAGDKLADTLAGLNFRGITNGILTQAFCPEKGLFLQAAYAAGDFTGKALCKERLTTTYGIPQEKALFLMMCRLVEDKGVEDVINAVHTIRDCEGFTLIVGRGSKAIEARLSELTRQDGVLWVKKWPHPMQTIPVLAGADFYLCPSIHEPCGLMPMTACRYGAIPICTLNGGLRDNMDEGCAIVIGDGGLDTAAAHAADLYADPPALETMRKACMERDFSWDTRKAGYLGVYSA